MNTVQPDKVKDYWEKIAVDFDAIYSGKKSSFGRWLDRVFRKDMYDRFRLTIEECMEDSISSVLDVGTGSGRFCLPLAEKKDKIMGIDFSAPMIELAKKSAEAAGVAEKCDFRVADFMELEVPEPFDAAIAIGVFDYIKIPVPFLEKMAGSAKVKVVATWPALWTWRVVPRWIRLNLTGCPVYFFTPSKLRSFYDQAGLEIQRLERVGKIYFVVARPRSR